MTQLHAIWPNSSYNVSECGLISFPTLPLKHSSSQRKIVSSDLWARKKTDKKVSYTALIFSNPCKIFEASNYNCFIGSHWAKNPDKKVSYIALIFSNPCKIFESSNYNCFIGTHWARKKRIKRSLSHPSYLQQLTFQLLLSLLPPHVIWSTLTTFSRSSKCFSRVSFHLFYF